MRNIKNIFKVLLWVACVGMVSNVWAMSPEKWMDIELNVRQLTVDGMQQRLHQLQQGASISEQLDADAAIQQAVVRIFQSHGITAADHLRWKSSNQRALDAWVVENYDAELRLLDIDRQYRAVAEALSSFKADQQTNAD